MQVNMVLCLYTAGFVTLHALKLVERSGSPGQLINLGRAIKP